MALKAKPLEKVRETVPVQAVAESKTARVNLNVPPDMRDRWKIAAIARKCSLSELVINAVNAEIEGKN